MTIDLEKQKFIQGNYNHSLFKSQATQLPHTYLTLK